MGYPKLTPHVKKYYTYEYDEIVFETSGTDPENEVWNLYGLNLISGQVKDGTGSRNK